MGILIVKNTKTLGLLIKSHRKSMNLTQVKLAGVSGVGVRFLSDLENGKPTVEMEKVLQVINSLGLALILQKNWNK